MHSAEKWGIGEVTGFIYSWIHDVLMTSLVSMLTYHNRRDSREQRLILVYGFRFYHGGDIITVDLEVML